MSAAARDNLISRADAEKLIAAHDGDVALLYLFRLATGSLDNELAAKELCRTLREIDWADEKLRRMGLSPAAQSTVAHPAPAAAVNAQAAPDTEELLSQYKSEDLTRRCRDDEIFRSILNEARKVVGRNLSSVEMKALFGVYDYLGLPSDVLMLLINYCGRLYEEKYHGQRRPTVRAIQKEADLWARQEVMTLELAEDFMRAQDERRSRVSQVKEALGIRGRELSPTERGYINSWLDMGFEDEALAEAYDRTVTNTGSLRWNYMNKILLSWHEKGLHRLREILDKEGRGRRTSAGEGKNVDLSGLDELINKI